MATQRNNGAWAQGAWASSSGARRGLAISEPPSKADSLNSSSPSLASGEDFGPPPGIAAPGKRSQGSAGGAAAARASAWGPPPGIQQQQPAQQRPQSGAPAARAPAWRPPPGIQQQHPQHPQQRPQASAPAALAPAWGPQGIQQQPAQQRPQGRTGGVPGSRPAAKEQIKVKEASPATSSSPSQSRSRNRGKHAKGGTAAWSSPSPEEAASHARAVSADPNFPSMGDSVDSLQKQKQQTLQRLAREARNNKPVQASWSVSRVNFDAPPEPDSAAQEAANEGEEGAEEAQGYTREPQVLAQLHAAGSDRVAEMVGEYNPNERDVSASMLRVATREWNPDKLEHGCELLNQGIGLKIAARDAGVLAGDLKRYWLKWHAHNSDDEYDSDDAPCF